MTKVKFNCYSSVINYVGTLFVLLSVISCLIEPSACSSNRELSRVKRSKDDAKLDWIIEKIKSIETMLALQKYIPKCAGSIADGDLVGGSKYWSQIKIETGNSSQSNQLLEEAIEEIITDSYKGKLDRITFLLKFIENEKNFVSKSPLAERTYQLLINAMEDYGQLICKVMPVAGLIVGVPSHTFRTLKQVKNNAGTDSAVFKSIPSSGRNIILGQEVVLKNKLTGAYLYLHLTDACEGISAEECTKPRVVTSDNFPNKRDERFIWRFKPVEHKWEEGFELYYIENPTGDKVLAVRAGDGSITVKTVNDDTRRSTWAMFYVYMVNKENEVIIQCSYWGLKTLAFQSNDTVVPKLMDPNLLKPLDEEMGGRWGMQEWKVPA